jgi:hypothetical protein
VAIVDRRGHGDRPGHRLAPQFIKRAGEPQCYT